MILPTVYTAFVNVGLSWTLYSHNTYDGRKEVATVHEHAKILGLTLLKEL